MKKQLKFAFVLVLVLSFFGCSRATSISAPNSVIPRDWIVPGENSEAEIHSDARTDAAVKSVFRINSQAVDALNEGDPLSRAADTTPWQLSGIIASFAVSIDGLFGPLVYDGTPSIQGTWTRRGTISAPIVHPVAHAPALVVTRDTTSADLVLQLEPAIVAALDSGHIRHHEKLVRTNVLKYAEKFRVIAQMLSGAKLPGWEVENYRLELNINASGQVTPVVGAGAAVNLRFDWDKAGDVDLVGNSDSPIVAFVQDLSREIQVAANEATPLQNAGFRLNEFRIGVGISSSGTVGIAREQGSAEGSITFSRRENNGKSAELASSPVNLIRSGDDFSVERTKFRRGLRRAIKMGSYFARMSKNESANSKWEVSEIEAEFDFSAGGTLGLATTSGIGVAVLTFAKEGV